VASLASFIFLHLLNIRQAGEDLEEIEEEDEEQLTDEEERQYDRPSRSQGTSTLQTGPEPAQGSLARILARSQPSKPTATETSPLLPRASSLPRSRVRRRRGTVSHGDATVGQAVLMVRHHLPIYYPGTRAHPFFVALEIIRRNWGFVFGESVSLAALPIAVR
jgi:hypothetical protein